jgi:hypothetical protein
MPKFTLNIPHLQIFKRLFLKHVGDVVCTLFLSQYGNACLRRCKTRDKQTTEPVSTHEVPFLPQEYLPPRIRHSSGSREPRTEVCSAPARNYSIQIITIMKSTNLWKGCLPGDGSASSLVFTATSDSSVASLAFFSSAPTSALAEDARASSPPAFFYACIIECQQQIRVTITKFSVSCVLSTRFKSTPSNILSQFRQVQDIQHTLQHAEQQTNTHSICDILGSFKINIYHRTKAHICTHQQPITCLSLAILPYSVNKAKCCMLSSWICLSTL